MSNSPTSFMPDPNQMKKKVLTAVIAVVIGHAGVLWAVSNMKIAELKPVEKPPVKVRFVQIKEDIPPPPPLPVTPVKPKPKPVEKKPEPVVQPKIVSKKVTKPVTDVKHQDDTKEKLRDEQLKREQELRDQQAREKAERDKAEREKADRERAEREKADRERADREREEATKPRQVSMGELSWSRKPVFKYSNDDLKGSNRNMLVALEVDASGKITSARASRSSGLSSFDEKILRSVRNARFKPVKGGGIVTTSLPLEFELNTKD